MTAITLRTLDRNRLIQKQPVDGQMPWPVYEDAAQLAGQLSPELPVLCFSARQLEASVKVFLDGFPGHVAYAVKANSSAEVVDGVAGAGVTTFDVASVSEMAGVRQVLADCAFHYHNPVKSRREIAVAYDVYSCRRYAADCIAEINKIAEEVGDVDGVEIAVRFRLPSVGHSAHDFSTKFGATPNEAVELLRHASRLGFGCVLTFHPGSQCVEPAAWARHIKEAAEIGRAAGVVLKVLNVGGGFPSRYARRSAPELQVFFDLIAAAASDAFGASGVPQLECEPGRAIAARSQSVLTRVKLVKPERGEIFLNDGIYGALMEISQVPELVPPHRAIRPHGEFGAQPLDWIVYGPTCDPLDTLPVKLALPGDIAEDDYIEFGTIGAYGTATATGFNGYGKFERAWLRNVLAL